MLFSLYFVLITDISLVVANITSHILVGDFVSIKTYPHSVLMNVHCGGYSWICGSSLVNQNTLLTAAHCLSDCERKWNIDAYAGQEIIENMTTRRSVVRFRIHSNYNEKKMVNDISLAIIEREFILGDNIKRVTITKLYQDVKYARVAGWGLVNERTNEESITLKSAKQEILQPSKCSKLGRMKPGKFCASWVDSRSRPSRGDSGSALVINNGDIQLGVVSYRAETEPGLVAYTNVSYFYDWILETSEDLYCSK